MGLTSATLEFELRLRCLGIPSQTLTLKKKKKVVPSSPQPSLAEANPEPVLLPMKGAFLARWPRSRRHRTARSRGSCYAARWQQPLPRGLRSGSACGWGSPTFRGPLALRDHAARHRGLPAAHRGWPGKRTR